MKFRIQFVINGLGTGGAEMMLYKLLSRIDRDCFVPEVVSLTDINDLASKFQEIEVPVRTLGMRLGVPDPRGVYRLVKVFRKTLPHLVQTWMYHSDLVGGLATQFVKRTPIIWNIRHSNLDSRSDKQTTILSAKACARLSHFLPAKIVCCAEVARQIHETIGYASSKMVIIPNGFDLSAFKPDPVARLDVCRELGISNESLIVGLAARYHSQKDHKTFVHAASLLKSKSTNVNFVLCGEGISWGNKALVEQIVATGFRDSFHLLGRRTDMPRLVASFDIASSSSVCGEAFSNTVGEAMACGVPCVVTDVGDSAFIVGDTGKVVPPGNPEALSAAFSELAILGEGGRLQLGQLARERILKNFSLELIVKKYEELYFSVLKSSC